MRKSSWTVRYQARCGVIHIFYAPRESLKVIAWSLTASAGNFTYMLRDLMPDHARVGFKVGDLTVIFTTVLIDHMKFQVRLYTFYTTDRVNQTL